MRYPFELFWRRRTAPGEVDGSLPRIRQSENRGSGTDFAPPDPGPMVETEAIPAVERGTASSSEVLRQADFAELTPAEERDAFRTLGAPRPRLPRRHSRRQRLGRDGSRPTARAMLRQSLATGGHTLDWRRLRRTTKSRPHVLICDISGTMGRCSRFPLRFAPTLAGSGAPVEMFAVGARLTRLRRELRVRGPDAALRRVSGR